MVLALLACLVACNPANDVVQFSVDPKATDPLITELGSDHTIFVDPKVKPTRGLLVFLSGTNGITTNTTGFCSVAAEDGYQVINLMYPNKIAAAVVQNSRDDKAFANLRWEVIEGRDLSPEVNVKRADSIENRLIKALEYLNKTRPREGWGKYLKNGELVWSDITLSGGSQGAGHAVLIATRFVVKRVISFAGPKDYRQSDNEPAAWYKPCATPAARIYAFNHEQDRQGCDYKQQLENLHWLGLDRFGGPINVDSATPPFRHSRILVTNFPGTPLPSLRAHSSVIGDKSTPRTETGDYRFRPVWHYMLTNED